VLQDEANAASGAENASKVPTSSSLPEQVNSRFVDSGLASSSFADLMQWSEEAPEQEPATASRGLHAELRPVQHDSSDLVQQASACTHVDSKKHVGCHTPSYVDTVHRSQKPMPKSGQRAAVAQASSHQAPSIGTRRPQCGARSQWFSSPFLGSGRSPMCVPRSPFATYFDD